jgi:hypothetical protein
LLAADDSTRVRFVPDRDYSGTVERGLAFRACDQSTGSNGAAADASVYGSETAFSVETATAAIDVLDRTPPMVGDVTSTASNAAYKAGTSIPILVQFSEAVTVTGTPQLTLHTGSSNRAVDYLTGTGTATLTFQYIVQAGESSDDLDYAGPTALELNGGTIRDAAGNDALLMLAAPGATGATGSLSANKDLAIDTTAPVVTIGGLVNNDSNLALTRAVSDGTLQVVVNGSVYVAGDGNLVVEGTTWSLPSWPPICYCPTEVTA